jgi:enoyl-[acyl-carrier-protein] reductase (NADH)
VERQFNGTADAEAAREAMNAFLPAGRMVTADEVAGAIAYLASPLSGASVGTVLAVDNGMHGLRLRPQGQQHLIGR